ncbi:MAG: HEAT repeat domain-containing protein [Candidatus Diapherotrites archaeon]
MALKKLLSSARSPWTKVMTLGLTAHEIRFVKNQLRIGNLYGSSNARNRERIGAVEKKTVNVPFFTRKSMLRPIIRNLNKILWKGRTIEEMRNAVKRLSGNNDPRSDSILLKAAATHPEGLVRMQAIYALDRLVNKKAAGLLAKALTTDKSKDARFAAAISLSGYKTFRKTVEPALKQALNDPEAIVKKRARETLEQLGWMKTN